MDPNLREQLRLSLLRHLDTNGTRFGMQEGYLLQLVRAEGLSLATREDITAEMLYLEDKGLARTVVKLLSPELRAWQITAAGRDHFAQLTT
jgi:hypothetical protein